jgi:hypothetical protein
MTIAENIALVRGYDKMLGLIDWRSTGEIAERDRYKVHGITANN